MPEPITPELIYHLKTVGDPALSPDATFLAYMLGWVDEESLGARSRIMLMDLGNGTCKEVTDGEKDSAPKFSPDGSRLAFLRSVDGDPAQVWAMAADGGEVKQLTQGAKGVSDYAWSPDGKTMVVCGDVDPEEIGRAHV